MLPVSALLLHLCSSSAGDYALLLYVSCSALLVAPHPALLIHLKPALLLAFSLVVLQLTHNSSAWSPALLVHKCSRCTVDGSSLLLVALARFAWTRYCYRGAAANFYTLSTANLSRFFCFFGIFVLYLNGLYRRIFST